MHRKPCSMSRLDNHAGFIKCMPPILGHAHSHSTAQMQLWLIAPAHLQEGRRAPLEAWKAVEAAPTPTREAPHSLPSVVLRSLRPWAIRVADETCCFRWVNCNVNVAVFAWGG